MACHQEDQDFQNIFRIGTAEHFQKLYTDNQGEDGVQVFFEHCGIFQNVTENGQITYTFVISNTGNTEAAATDNVVVTDTFDPLLRNIAVTYNGTAWTEGTNYTYNAATGVFTTQAGQITVPAASFSQNADGTFAVTPGTATLVITGTV